MPGIFINDGGGLQKSIGDILGGIATNMGPQAQAEAQNLKYRTEGQDISNQQALEILKARQRAEAQTPGFLSTFGADAQPPGSVANTTASLAQPPLGVTPIGNRSTVDMSNFTPFQAVTAARIAQGDFSPAEQAATVNLGQSQVSGPGSTYSATATRATTPLGAGQVINTTGQPGGPTMGGGSSYVHAGDEAAGTTDYKLAMDDLESGGNAKANLGKIDPIIDLFKSAVAPGVANTGAKLQGDLLTKLVTSLGGDPNRYLDPNAAKALLKQNLLSFIGGLRDSAGNPLPRGATDLIVQQIPDPETDLNGFLASMNWVKAHLQAQAARADAAQTYVNQRQTDPNAGPAFHTARGAAWSAEADAYARSGLKGAEGGEGGGGGGQVYIFSDEGSMEAAGAAGSLPDGARVQLGYGPKGVSGTYHKGAK